MALKQLLQQEHEEVLAGAEKVDVEVVVLDAGRVVEVENPPWRDLAINERSRTKLVIFWLWHFSTKSHSYPAAFSGICGMPFFFVFY